MRITPLDRWISDKIGLGPEERLTVPLLRAEQLGRLCRAVDHARQHSPFYRNHLIDMGGWLPTNTDDLESLPFTVSEHIRNGPHRFLCVSQSRVERVISIFAPGSDDKPKRIYFTAEDLELTADFFHHGMSTLTEPGQTVLILMPGDRPWSVGDLLVKALERMSVRGIVHGIVLDPERAIEDICKHEADCLVGIPTQLLGIARHPRAHEIPNGLIKSVLLSADYVPAAITEELRRTWGCRVLGHYGTIEAGLGGGVECDAAAGYHLREADLYFEIVDPDSGRPQPAGVTGEAVFTTLTRTGMPLIRYRTGDLSRFIPEACPCGSALPRMDKIRGRIKDMVRLRTGEWLGIHDLDEILFRFPEVANYSATIIEHTDRHRLEPAVLGKPGCLIPSQNAIETALSSSPRLRAALDAGCLEIGPVRTTSDLPVSTGTEKRCLIKGSTVH